ncbi:MAG: tetratricopeptide repeat protein [Anaerolineae bacterium]
MKTVTIGTFYGVSLAFEDGHLTALSVGVHRKDRIPIAERWTVPPGEMSRPALDLREQDDPEMRRLGLDPATGRQAEQPLGRGKRRIEVFQGRGVEGSDAVTARARMIVKVNETAAWTLLLQEAQGRAVDGGYDFDLPGRTRVLVRLGDVVAKPQYGWEGNVVGVRLELPAGRPLVVDLWIESRPEYDVNDTLVVCPPHQVAEAAVVVTCLPTHKFQPLIDLPARPEDEGGLRRWESRLSRYADLIQRLPLRRIVYLHPYDPQVWRLFDPSGEVEQLFFLPERTEVGDLEGGQVLRYQGHRHLAELAWEHLAGREALQGFPLPREKTEFYPFGVLDALRKGRSLLLEEMDFVPTKEQVAEIVNQGAASQEVVIVEEEVGLAAIIGALYARYIGAHLYVNRPPELERVEAALRQVMARVDALFDSHQWPEDGTPVVADLLPLVTAQVDDYIRQRLRRPQRLTVFTRGMPYTFVRGQGEVPEWGQMPIGHVIAEPAMLTLREVMARAIARPPLSFSLVFDPGFFGVSEAEWTTEQLAKTPTYPLFLQGSEANPENLLIYPRFLPVEELVFVTHGTEEGIVLKDAQGEDRLLREEEIRCECHLSSLPVVFNNSCISWVGVGGAFVGAGARGYVGTLWSVENEAAIEIAKGSTEAMLAEGKPVAEALAGVQVEDELTKRAYIYVGLASSELGTWEYDPRERPEVLRRALDDLFPRLNDLANQGHVHQSWTLYEKYRDIAEDYLSLARDPQMKVPPEAQVDIRLQEAYYLANVATKRDRATAEAVIEKCQEALDLVNRLPLSEGEKDQRRALAWGRMAYVQFAQGDWAEALANYQQSLGALRGVGDREKTAACLRKMGQIHQGRGEWAEAEARYTESLAICREAGIEQGEAESRNDLGALYLKRGRPEEALAHLEASLALCERLGDEETRSQVLINLGLVHEQQGQWGRAQQRYQEALTLCEKLGDRRGMASCYHNLGNLLYGQEEWGEARSHYERGLALSRELGDREGEADSLHQMGAVLRRQGRLSEALTHLRESLELTRAMGDRPGEMRTLFGLGLTHEDRGRVAEALGCYQSALEVARRLGDEEAAGILQGKIEALQHR